jgi:hypothetical protein
MQGLCYPVSRLVLVALLLENMVLSISKATLGPPCVCHISSHDTSVETTPWLGPSFPVATCCDVMHGNLLSVHTPRQFLVRSSMYLPHCYESLLSTM